MISHLINFFLSQRVSRFIIFALLVCFVSHAQSNTYSLYTISTGAIPDTTVIKNNTDSLFHQAGNTFSYIGKLNPRRYSAWFTTEAIPAMLKDTAALKASIDSKATAASVSSLAANMIPWTDTVNAGPIMTITKANLSIATLNSSISTKFNQPSGSTSQYIRGDGSISAFPSIPTQTGQISESSNLYYTDARARAAVTPDTFAVKVYNAGGLVSKYGKIFTDTIAISTATPTISLSSYLTAMSATSFKLMGVTGYRIGSTATTSPQVSISAITGTSVSLVISQPNTATVTIVGIPVLSGLPTILTPDPTNVKVVLSFYAY